VKAASNAAAEQIKEQQVSLRQALNASVVRREAKRWLSVDEVDAEIVNRDRLVTLAIGVLAIVLGFYLIWLDNLAWGTPKDFFAAFFWGLGMHQVAGNAIFSKLDLDQLEKQVTGKT
jgi:hypothetical protein